MTTKENTGVPTPTPTALTNEQIIAAMEAQLAAIDLPTVDSESAKAWLKDFRLPIASLTTNALVGLVRSRLSPTSDADLAAHLRALSASDLNQVMKANAATLAKISSERAREVALIRLTHEKITTSAASILMAALTKTLGVTAVAPKAPSTKSA